MLIHLLSRNNHLYSTQRLFQAAVAAGCGVEIFDYSCINCVYAGAGPRLSYQGEPLAVPDVVIGRISPQYTPLGSALLQQYAQLGAACSPRAEALLLARDKWRSIGVLSQNGLATPYSAMVSDLDGLDDAVERLRGYPVVLKLLEGTHGQGVMLAPTPQAARSILGAFAGLNRGVLVQEYVAETRGADVRAIVCGGEVVAAMTRTPARDEFRSNLHRGGTARATTLSDDEGRLAVRAAEAVGLPVAGVDLLRAQRGPLVMEVNASPGLEGIEHATGTDVAGAIIAHLVGAVAKATAA